MAGISSHIGDKAELTIAVTVDDIQSSVQVCKDATPGIRQNRM
jgi:hypothetical protein